MTSEECGSRWYFCIASQVQSTENLWRMLIFNVYIWFNVNYIALKKLCRSDLILSLGIEYVTIIL